MATWLCLAKPSDDVITYTLNATVMHSRLGDMHAATVADSALSLQGTERSFIAVSHSGSGSCSILPELLINRPVDTVVFECAADLDVTACAAT